MLFDSTLRRDLARSFGATLVVILTIVLTMMLIRTLGLAAGGKVSPQDVVLLLGYTALAHLPTMLALSMFVAVVGTLGRMYRDSEMVIWLSSGQGLFAVVRPLLRFAWPVFAVVAGLALVILPWTNLRIEELKNQYQQRGDLERVEPGQFQESADGKRVFFIDKDVSGAQGGANVFVVTTEEGTETVTSARSGRIETLATGRFLLLDNGQRLERAAGSAEIKVSNFEQYGVQIGQDALEAINFVPVNTRTTAELLDDLSPVHWAELSWRLGLILISFNFVIIAVSVSSVNPRVGRSTNLVFALFTFVFYFNLLGLGQNMVATGKFSFFQMMLGLHGSVFVLALLMLAKNHLNLQWREVFSLSRWRPKVIAA